MFKHAVDAYKNISDLQYTKGRYEAVKDMKGFQRMDAAQHPVVQRGQQVYKIISTRKYIEDWMEEKEYIYFPVQITEAYNNSIRVSKYQSNLTYQAGYQRFKYENTFQYDKTPGYQFSLDLSNKISDAIYRKQAKAEMEGKRWAAHLTPKCIYDNELKELLSNENYKRNARKVMDTYSVDMHLPYIQNSIAVTKFVSHTRYTENYRKNVLGKFIATTFADYPEYGHALAVSRNQSEPLYKEAALKNHCKYTLVADQHQFLQAKEHTKLMSSDYGKGKRDAIETMKGFMRMDATIHPVVVEGTKKHKLMSDIKYKEDYNMDKDWNMYTFTITPVYEQHQKNKANAFEKNYTDAAKKGNETVKFNVHETEMHQNKMATQKLVGDKLYQKDKYDLQGYSTCNSNEHEMYLFKEIAPLLSAKRYCAVAKDLLGKYHLEVDNPTMVSAFQAQALTSEAMYRKKYMKEVLGKFCDIKDAEMFNQYKCVAELVSDNLYRKKAISGMGIYASNQINPDMQHCIEVMKIVSDKEYTKNLKDVQKKFSAFSRQRLEHSPNLEFQRQIQAQVSSYEYKRDYEEEKNYVYFPVHITEGYSLAMKCSKFFSNKFYKEKYMKDRNERSNYLFTHTPSYEFQKTINESIYRGNYQKKYLETRDKNNYNCIDDPVSLQAREISQIISNNLYNAEAKKMLQNYNLSVDNPALLHAKACQKLTSENNYKQWLKHPDAAHHSMGLDEWVLRFTIDHAKSIGR